METTENKNQTDRFIIPTVTTWSHLTKTRKLSSSARNMLDVFVAYMRPDDNLVHFSCGAMEAYLQFCSKDLQLVYTEKTIRNAISELRKAGLLLRARKNIYYINPMHFFKLRDDMDHRKLISNIEEQTGVILIGKGSREVEILKKREQGPAEANTR